MTGIYFLGNV